MFKVVDLSSELVSIFVVFGLFSVIVSIPRVLNSLADIHWHVEAFAVDISDYTLFFIAFDYSIG